MTGAGERCILSSAGSGYRELMIEAVLAGALISRVWCGMRLRARVRENAESSHRVRLNSTTFPYQ